jgi:hypothetical protein
VDLGESETWGQGEIAASRSSRAKRGKGRVQGKTLGRLNKIADRVIAGIFSDGRESKVLFAAERPTAG